MKDLSFNDNRPDREDSDGEGGRRPAYASFVKDKRYRNDYGRSDSGNGSGQRTTDGNEYRRPRREGGDGGYRRYENRSTERRDDYRRDGGTDGNRYGDRNIRRERNDSEHKTYDRNTGGEENRRRSFNPNFDSSNRLIDRNNGEYRERTHDRERNEYVGDRPRYGEGGYRKRNDSENRDRTGYDRNAERRGDYPQQRRYNNGGDSYVRKYQSRPAYDRKRSDDMSEDRTEERPSRNYSQERAGRGYGGKRYDRRDGQQGAGRQQYRNGNRPNRTPKYDSEHYPTFPAPVIEDKIRLNRYIAMSGICSRREADEFIQSGIVTVNGMTVTELGAKVSQNDEIRFNGNVIKNEQKVYIVMNKPKGFVTSVEDPHAEKTVMELLKNGCRERVYPVGRLDKNSLGVLLITNDGDLAKKLTHPSYEKKKVYQVTLDKPLTRADMDSLVEGFELEDGEIHADEVSYVNEKKNEVGVEIHSGRNRIVRRMFEHLGYRVTKLDRVYFAGLTKQKLKRGEWRFLTPREVSALLSGRYE